MLARDSHRCQVLWDGQPCGWRARDVDHIVNNDDDSPSNLQAICSWHHKRKTAQEGNAARWAQRETRTPEAHPGLR